MISLSTKTSLCLAHALLHAYEQSKINLNVPTHIRLHPLFLFLGSLPASGTHRSVSEIFVRIGKILKGSLFSHKFRMFEIFSFFLNRVNLGSEIPCILTVRMPCSRNRIFPKHNTLFLCFSRLETIPLRTTFFTSHDNYSLCLKVTYLETK